MNDKYELQHLNNEAHDHLNADPEETYAEIHKILTWINKTHPDSGDAVRVINEKAQQQAQQNADLTGLLARVTAYANELTEAIESGDYDHPLVLELAEAVEEYAMDGQYELVELDITEDMIAAVARHHPVSNSQARNLIHYLTYDSVWGWHDFDIIDLANQLVVIAENLAARVDQRNTALAELDQSLAEADQQ